MTVAEAVEYFQEKRSKLSATTADIALLEAVQELHITLKQIINDLPQKKRLVRSES